ncbi:MAG: hypothetical protein DRQ39_04095 [Gammaproteobacteria bacterium]|nr:MAG: hypothetical protein DRQ39_04095 [Gammaproteobacteria bacterium]
MGSGSLEVGSGFGGSSSIGGGHTSVNTDSTGQPSAGLGGGGSGASVINNTEEHFGGAGGAGAVVITEYLS